MMYVTAVLETSNLFMIRTILGARICLLGSGNP